MATCTVKCNCGNVYLVEVEGRRNFTTEISGCYICNPTTKSVKKIKSDKPKSKWDWREMLN